MDAAQKLIKNTALFLAMALLVAVPGRSQSQLSATPNPVALTGQNPTQTSVPVSVLGSGPFTISQVGSFFSVSKAGDTAPASFTVSLTSTACLSNNSCSGSITLTPTSASGGGTPVAISVTFAASGSGGGGTVGAIFASPASVTLNTVTGQAVSTTVSLTTSSTTAISFSFSTTPANNASWLSVSQNSNSVSATSSATLNVYANASNITTQQTGSITITPGNGGAQTVIPVTLNVNGTGGSTYSVSPTNVSLAYPGSPQSQQIVIFSNNSAVTTFNATVTNCSSTNFLYLTGGFSSGTSIANQPVSSNLNLTLNNASTLATGSYSCQAVVSNPSNSADQVAITVTLAVNGGSGSGGGFTLSPATLSFTSAPGSTNSQTTYVSVTSTAQTTFTANFTSQSSPNNTTNWITLNGSTSTTITGQPVSNGIYIGLNNPQSFSAGSYSGYVTISNPNTSGSATLSVFLTVTSSGSSGSSYTLNVNSATFQYPSGAQSANISVSSNTQSQFIATTSVTGGAANWLLVYQNGASGISITGTVGSTNPLTVYLNSSAVPQVTGTYTGYVKIANPSNSNDYALVTVSLAVNGGGSGGASATPTSLSFSTPVGVAPAQQTVAVTVPSSSTTFTASLQAASGSVFVVSPCNGCTYTGSQNLAVSVSPGSLGAGTYTDYISLTSNGSTFATITVTLTVGGSGSTGSIAAPTSLSFFYETGQSTPFAQTVMIAASGAFTATPTQSWIAVNPTSGTGPANVTVSVIPQSFAAGSVNTGTINIATPSGGQSVNVSLSVSSGVGLYANPGTITLTTPNYQNIVTISASDNSSQTVSVTTSTSWISLTGQTNNGSTPVSYLVTVNPAGLCNGLNTGSITATASGAANNPLTIPVTVLITGSSVTSCGSSTGPLTLSASSLTFSGAVNGAAPSNQVLTVTAPSTSTYFTVSTAVQTGNWLTVPSPCSYCYGSQSYNLVVAVNQSGLSAGTYQGTITLNANGTLQQVTVTLTVGTSGGNGNINATPGSVTFTAQVNGSAPAGQTVTVASTSGLAVGYVYTLTPIGSWLSASAGGATLSNGQGLTTPTTLTVNVNPSGLAAGTYSGTITLSPNGGTAFTISVGLTVQNNVVSASPSSLTFSYTAGSTAPSPQPVTVSSGTAGLAFSTQVSAGNCASGWLAASPATGTTQGSVSVSVNPGSLGAGTCNGTVTISGTGGATGSTTVSVSLTVTAPLPTITQVGSAASYLGAAISPGEIITIFGTSLGPTPYVTLALDSTGKVATALGGVQVLVAGFPAPMVFASNTQVSAVVPYEIAQLHGSQPVVVKFLGQTSNAIGVQVAPTAPGIFTSNASGTGPGAISNQNYSANSPTNPAAKGSVVAIYMTGEGLTSPASATGSVTTATLPPPQVTPAPLLPVAVLIDGQPAAIAYAGEAPGLVAGVMQVNVVIPAGARTGDLPLVVSVGGTSSQGGVTVSVR